MQMKFPLLAAVLGLLATLPAYAQTNTPSESVQAWRARLAAHLAEKKRFPPEAGGQSGNAKVIFVIDRSGKLISSALVESTGSQPLDEAALAMVERAEPFPEPPPELKEDTFTFTVPVFFKGPAPVSDELLQSWIDEQTRKIANSPSSEKDDARLNAKLHTICRGC
jgi:protein TonB